MSIKPVEKQRLQCTRRWMVGLDFSSGIEKKKRILQNLKERKYSTSSFKFMFFGRSENKDGRLWLHLVENFKLLVCNRWKLFAENQSTKLAHGTQMRRIRHVCLQAINVSGLQQQYHMTSIETVGASTRFGTLTERHYVFIFLLGIDTQTF